MNEGQIELIRRLAEIIELIASEPDSYSVDYIQSKYLLDIATDEELKENKNV